MSAPYNPGSGGSRPGEQPQWGGYPGGANYPQQGQPGYPGQSGEGGYQQQPGSYQQGGYQGYQPGNYPQPQGGYSYQQPSWGGYDEGEERESVRVIGLVTAVVGAVLLVLGAAALNWYSQNGQHVKLHDLYKDAKAGNVGLMKAYGGYLIWVLIAVVVISAVLASLPIGSSAQVFRVLAPLVGAVGIVLTLVALNSYFDKVKAANPGVDVGIFKHSAVGLYLTLIGFLVAGIAGVFGPRRV